MAVQNISVVRPTFEYQPPAPSPQHRTKLECISVAIYSESSCGDAATDRSPFLAHASTVGPSSQDPPQPSNSSVSDSVPAQQSQNIHNTNLFAPHFRSYAGARVAYSSYCSVLAPSISPYEDSGHS
ncbi:hypothetical protein D9619_009824 [Psilocybe cf. subviscida]|uniref:Uncharacterized protein n=1 Tax=Psilocybe cf. subviscida TaxID=2480587 RepID=A0A8H5BL34_9AGAR|nr:hypothetical protein D9619_009824 [Psilocybe cf. subviscida]